MKTLLLIIVFALAASAQQLPTIDWASSETCKICDKMIIQDREYFIFNGAHRLAIAAEYSSSHLIITVGITNNKETRFDFIPESHTTLIGWKTDKDQFFNNNPKTYAAIPASKIIAGMQARAAWANIFRSTGAAMQTQTTKAETTSGTSTATTTITTPDANAKANAERDNRATNQNVQSEAASLQATALRANTILPGSRLAGFLYFPKPKKMKVVQLQITLDGTVYRVLFDN